MSAFPKPAAAPRVFYARRSLLNAGEVVAWYRERGFRTTLPAEELHATLAYSRAPVDELKLPPPPDLVRVRGGRRRTTRLGDEGAVVLRFESPELESRWAEYRRAGASWDYEGFEPHVTVTYGGAPPDPSTVAPYPGELLFGPEVAGYVEPGYDPPPEEDRAAPVLKAASTRRGRARIAARELRRIERRYGPRVARAFRRAVLDLKATVKLRVLTEALLAGDVDGALRATGLDELPDRLRTAPLGRSSALDELVAALREGGDAGRAQLPASVALRASLDLTNPEAVAYLQRRVPEFLREATDDSREAVRAAVSRGFTEGRDGPAIAREVREAIGLTRVQQGYVANFRRQLETGELGNATPPWLRRLSAVERRQARRIFEQTEAVRQAKIDQLVNRYAESLLNRRALNVARTEVNRASGAGQTELWRQATDRGLLDPEGTRRVWIVTPDDRLRESHAAVPGLNPDGVGLDEPFATPIGPVFAPRESGNPGFDVNCRCTVALEFPE